MPSFHSRYRIFCTTILFHLLISVIYAWEDASVIPRIPAIQNPGYIRNGTLEVEVNSAKRIQRSESQLSNSLIKRKSGSVVAIPRGGGAKYLCPVSIGGQSLNIHFDTGSADLWVLTSSLQIAPPLPSHQTYSPQLSNKFKEMDGYNWHISYQDGSSASGVVGTDMVAISSIVAKSQVFGLADIVSVSFLEASGDGLLGLAFNNINTIKPIKQKTFLDNVEDSLDEPLFTVYLPPNANGSYDFGAVDHSKYTGDMWWTRIDTSNGFWEFESSGYKIGSVAYLDPGRTGIADTGSSLIFMPDKVVDAYYQEVSTSFFSESKKGYLFNCDDYLPSLSIRIGPGFYADIPPELLIFSQVDSEDNLCFGSLQTVGKGKQNMYGDVLFNAYFGIFDRRGPILGMAKINA